MMELEIQANFVEILKKLRGRQATLSDISQLIVLVRCYKKKIPDEIKRVILSIPNIILREQCKLKNGAEDWANKFGEYFSNNCVELTEWQKKFGSKNFDLQDMSDFMEYILEEPKRLNSDFYLRNPEVTLRESVCLKSERKFQYEQIRYALILEKALMM